MTCYWLRFECALTLVNKMETFGRWAAFCAESQHDLVWGGQGQGFSCKNTIWQTLKSLRVACGGKCATTNYCLKVVQDEWLNNSDQPPGQRVERAGQQQWELMDTQRNTQAVFSTFIDAVGKLKEKSPTERLSYPWANLWAFPKSKCTFTKLHPKEETLKLKHYSWAWRVKHSNYELSGLSRFLAHCSQSWDRNDMNLQRFPWEYNVAQQTMKIYSIKMPYKQFVSNGRHQSCKDCGISRAFLVLGILLPFTQ